MCVLCKSKGLFIELKQLNSFHIMFCIHCENCLYVKIVVAKLEKSRFS